MSAIEKKRNVPYAVMNWEELVTKCYFVDHTRFIPELEKCKTPVFLRPKRFGKTSVCSMLAHYYDINRKDDFQRLFGKTDIGKNPTDLANSFLVLNFDFSTLTVGTVEAIERDFTQHVREQSNQLIARYSEMKTPKGESVQWPDLEKCATSSAIINALRDVVLRNSLPPIYVIIDEYDNFTNELIVSNRDAEYDAICGHDNDHPERESFFKAFFKSFKAGLADGSVGRTYFTGVLPITLDDLSSGFNVGTVVSNDWELLGLVGFTQEEIDRYVDEIFEDNGLEPAKKQIALNDLKAFYDGYKMDPDQTGGLYNSTIANWYLRTLVVDHGRIPRDPIDANVRTDIGWFRRLAGAKAFEKVRGYVERGEGEIANRAGLLTKFGRVKFFSEEFYPYALYYLGLMTFKSPFKVGIPNLTIKNMFIDYYDELSECTNIDAARRAFVGACEDLALNGGTWKELFTQYWIHYVKARIPAQAYDQMNENFFRLTFTSRCWDALSTFYSFQQELNTPEGRVDFLATPKPGVAKPACLIEYKYFRRGDFAAAGVKENADGTCDASARTAPDAETLAQAKRYRDSLLRKDWYPRDIYTVVVEVYSHFGWKWFEVDA